MTPTYGERELQVEVNFDCAFQFTQIKRTSANLAPSVAISSATANVQKPVGGVALIPQGINAICINYRGTLLARMAGNNRLILLAPRSLTFVRGGTRLVLQAARGEHDAVIISWHTGVTPGLEAWIGAKSSGRGGPMRSVACRAIEPNLSPLVGRIEAARSGPDELLEPLLLGAIHEAVARLATGPNEMQLATIPAGLPDTIQDLIKEVRGNSALSWPLKEAADKAGYSPFHFSRVFKQLVGYGFHEYVDRCRTESAVEMLVSSDSAVDLIASACGFGTTQGLRESVKEYLGLVPSELRNMPEIMARS